MASKEQCSSSYEQQIVGVAQELLSQLQYNRNYSAILATLQITSYALGVLIALLFTCQLHESLIKLYFKQFSIFQLKF